MAEVENTESGSSDGLDVLVDAYLLRKKLGERITIDEFADQFPEEREELLAILPTIDFLDYTDDVQPIKPLQLDNVKQALDGRFRIKELIGFGGMGAVYEAEHDFRSGVAVKVMLPEQARTGNRRFAREAGLASRLHHPNIVPVFDFGSVDDLWYFSMKKINGPNLQEILRVDSDPCATGRAKELADEMRGNWKRLARIGYQVASALDHSHSQGVLHRDVKPANLLFDQRGNVWVSDFGLAKMTFSESHLTQSSAAVGTLRYMAPEQINNEADERADIYSLGITLYEVARGLSGKDSVFYTRHPLDPIRKSHPGIPVGLDEVILKACEPDPEHRYQSARELADDLVKFCDRRRASTSLQTSTVFGSIAVMVSALFAPGGLMNEHPPVYNVVNTVREMPVIPSGIDSAWQTFDPETGITRLETFIAHSRDDVEEWIEGKMYVWSSDLEIIWDEGPQNVGLRFRYCGIPQNAEILNAYIQFTCDEADIGESSLEIRSEVPEDLISKPFSSKDYEVSNRTTSSHAVLWQPDDWQECSSCEAQQTPDLSGLIQPLIDNQSWTADHPVTFIISGTGKRTAISFDDDEERCPKLVVEFRERAVAPESGSQIQ
ncbi:MAG: serine/threonine-protein kinase [Planctomycetota bacterium]